MPTSPRVFAPTRRPLMLLAVCAIALSQMRLMCPPANNDMTARRPAVTDCGSVAVACYDELPRQPGQIVVFRPTSRWSRTALTWSAELHPALPIPAQNQVFTSVFDTWSAASGLTFTRVDANGDIRITFERGEHGDEFPFDGVGRRLGHAWFPSSDTPGMVHICEDENWEVPGKPGQFDLFTVVLHEVGHALGLEHSLAEDAVMGFSYDGAKPLLAAEDVQAIRRLYGSQDNSVQPLPYARPGEFGIPAPQLTERGDPDSDGDGIPDSAEIFYFATDPFSADTDGDGTDDFTEIFVRGTSPLDGGFDSDSDGVIDDEEFFFGTDPFNADSDGDNIGDGFEVFYYGTDPLNPDTDFDGVNDFDDPYPTYSDFLFIDACVAQFFDPDCNFSGLLDNCDVLLGLSADFNENFIPDECEVDSDGDGFQDFEDDCPLDPFKIDPGFCGCGIDDVDSDFDLFPDCFDGCPFDPFKIDPGFCGCGFEDTDFNQNDFPDCFE